MYARILKLTITIMCVLFMAGCRSTGFTAEEKAIINSNGAGGDNAPVMRVLLSDNPDDLHVLHSVSSVVTEDMFRREADELQRLCAGMLATVRHPDNDGVGIAAPQVGVLKRVIIVQRVDKEGEPFEVYLNPEITDTAGELVGGPEGCLSVPDNSGVVGRYRDIALRYNDPRDFSLREERLEGFVAVIFQHEIDHLNGILFTDRIGQNPEKPQADSGAEE